MAKIKNARIIKEEYDPKLIEKTFKAVKERCDAFNIEYEERSFEDVKYLILLMPNGRNKRNLRLIDPPRCKKLLSIGFEKYKFLGEYEAICSYEDGSIEALINYDGYFRRLEWILPGFYNETEIGSDSDINEEVFIELKPDDEKSSVTLSIARPTDEFLALSSRLSIRHGRRALCMRINGLKINKHDQSLDILERLFDALYLQVDILIDLQFSLVKTFKPLRRPLSPKSHQSEDISIKFPTEEYDKAPMSLYRYARSAHGMPLLQYLAFYQSIEFYFLTYIEEKTRKNIRNILKDPSFRSDKDKDITRILSACKSSGRGYGSELDQLKASLLACCDYKSLIDFLNENDERKEFFSKEQKGLTKCKINLKNDDIELINDISNLIYDIRCRIVHTKSEGKSDDPELLLPFSIEAELLYKDVELIQILSKQVLFYTSSHFRI